MAKRRRTPACASKALLKARGVNLDADFHALRSSDVDIVLAVAKAAGYRKSKSAPGSRARMFFQYLSRKRCA